jgi:hypothetical protein
MLSYKGAPDNLSNNRFYESLSGPTFYLNFTQYGHADILDDWVINFADIECSGCKTKGKNCDIPTYRKNLANAVSYFLNAVDEKNLNFLQAIQFPEKSGMFNSSINVEAKYKENGFNIINTGPFCNHL